MNDFADMNAVYAEFFDELKPTEGDNIDDREE